MRNYRRPFIAAVVLCALLGPLSWLVVRGETETAIDYGEPEIVAKLNIPALTESSGLAVSRIDANLLWTHNDSGDGPRLFAVATDGTTKGTCNVVNAKARDWEDMASFLKDGQPFLLVADTGDNSRKRKDYVLYRIPEQLPTSGALTVDQRVVFRFDEGPCDCEAIAFDATLDQVLLIDKGWSLSCRVFSLDWPSATNSEPEIAKHIATLPIAGITGMDVSPDGHRAIVLTYGPAYEFLRTEEETWAEAFSREGRKIRMPVRRQGESICYGADGRMIYLTSEKHPSPLYRVAVADPATAEGSLPAGDSSKRLGNLKP